MLTLRKTLRTRRPPYARAFTPAARATRAGGVNPAGLWPALALPRLYRPASALPPAGGPQPRSVKNVLIVEDDDLTREMLTIILRAEGYRSDDVANGQEALAHLRTAAAPDLILLDLWMPVMDGWEFCAAQAQDPLLASVPVVIISATPEDATELCRPLAAAAHLRKPITVEELLDVVRRC